MANVAVSRTLVKSPPEVWAELEREGRLAELLADESLEVTVAEELAVLEWRAQNASGRIEIKTSGWGTKVSLTAEVEDDVAAEIAEPAAATETAVAPEPEVERESEAVAEVELGTEPKAEQAPDATVDTESEPPQVSAKPGFWARIKSFFDSNTELAEHDVVEPTSQPALITEHEPEPEIESDVETGVEHDGEPDGERSADQSPTVQPTAPATGVDYEQRLTAVLDHLGSAHKRPFTSM